MKLTQEQLNEKERLRYEQEMGFPIKNKYTKLKQWEIDELIQELLAEQDKK